jgi:hypothetical protein
MYHSLYHGFSLDGFFGSILIQWSSNSVIFLDPAVYSYANALKRAHADKCGGMTGMCALLKSMTTEDFYLNYLSKTDFKYSKKERVESLALKGQFSYESTHK